MKGSKRSDLLGSQQRAERFGVGGIHRRGVWFVGVGVAVNVQTGRRTARRAFGLSGLQRLRVAQARAVNEIDPSACTGMRARTASHVQPPSSGRNMQPCEKRGRDLTTPASDVLLIRAPALPGVG